MADAPNRPDPAADDATARVVAPPPLIYLGFLLVAWGLDALWPLPALPEPAQYWVGGALFLAGFLLLMWAAGLFRAAGTNVPTSRPTRALVVRGPYRYSRNPIYIALTLAYLGIASAADLLWAAVLLPVLLVVIDRLVIAREERYLSARFGREYADFRDRVRRWL